MFLFKEKFISLQIVKVCKINLFIGLIMMVLGLFSCTGKQNAEVLSREFEGEMWRRFDYLTVSYEVVKAPMTADIVLEIEVSDVYPNVYPRHDEEDELFSITMSVKSPDGGSRIREYNYRLKDKDGNFKAEKTDGYYHFSLPLINEMTFGEKGEYVFRIENKYSKDPLYGIKSLKINCLQIKK